MLTESLTSCPARRGRVDLAELSSSLENARILFAGTPDIAVPLLRSLASSFNVVGVLTSCDKSVGRSSKLCPPPVKTAALELGIPVLQFDSLRTPARDAVRSIGANVLVSFAFGRIFGPMFLALFPNGRFNVHPSHLPLFRGPSPIQATILGGLREASISVQTIGEKMDEGDIWDMMQFPLDGTETTSSLTEKVSLEAASFVPNVLKQALCGEISPIAQCGEPSYCKMIDKADGRLDFSKSLLELHALVRASYPWPKAFALADGREVFITSVWGGFDELDATLAKTGESVCDGAGCRKEVCVVDPLPEPGTVVGFRKDRGIGIACADGVLWVNGLQLPAKKEMDHKAFVNGNRWILDAKFG